MTTCNHKWLKDVNIALLPIVLSPLTRIRFLQVRFVIISMQSNAPAKVGNGRIQNDLLRKTDESRIRYEVAK
jgi:hypothetical protein